MPAEVTVLLVLAAAAVAVLAMRVGWRHRAARTAVVVPALPPVPADGDPALGRATTGALPAIYVSTTVAGDWLERVVAHDLGVRSAAVVQVFTGGVRVERDGAADVFVPADALRAVATAPGMAGKYVGGDGLVVLTWEVAGGVGLDTGLRPRRAEDRTALLQAAQALVRTGSTNPRDTPAGDPPAAGTRAADTPAADTATADTRARDSRDTGPDQHDSVRKSS